MAMTAPTVAKGLLGSRRVEIVIGYAWLIPSGSSQYCRQTLWQHSYELDTTNKS